MMISLRISREKKRKTMKKRKIKKKRKKLKKMKVNIFTNSRFTMKKIFIQTIKINMISMLWILSETKPISLRKNGYPR